MTLIQSYRNLLIDSQYKSFDWFRHDIDRGHERVSVIILIERH